MTEDEEREAPQEEGPGPTPEMLLDQEKERYLRLAAEFDNFRKRSQRDMEEFRRRARDSILLELLEVMDSLDRALENCPDGEVQELVEGLRAIRNQMGAILEREGIEPIEAVGRPFDPFDMEAVMRMPSEEEEEEVVLRELQKGYRGRGYVLRPSKVIVSSGQPEPGAESTEAGEMAGDDETQQTRR